MQHSEWKDFSNFLASLGSLRKQDDGSVFLFRGQPCYEQLLPKIARRNPLLDTSLIELIMIAELRRNGDRFFSQSQMTELDILAIAQHHGMATRLLDWSTNPLVALWFACNNQDARSGHLYIYKAAKSIVISQGEQTELFNQQSTKIFKPNLSNSRVIAQSGWFSLHPHQGVNGVRGLDDDIAHFTSIYHMEIPESEKTSIMSTLNILGINHSSLFPDLDGLCKYINWQNGV